MADDNIVVLRAASREEPPAAQGNLSLSFSKGFVFDSNTAGRSLERLRKARSSCLHCFAKLWVHGALPTPSMTTALAETCSTTCHGCTPSLHSLWVHIGVWCRARTCTI